MRQLVQGLVGKGSGTRNDPNRATAGRNLSRGDPDIALAGTDDPGAVWPKQPGPREITRQAVVKPCFVLGGDTLGDHYDELDPCLRGLHDRTLDAGSRHEDARRRGTRCFTCIVNIRENWNAFDVLACPLRVGSGDHLGTVLAITQPIETACAAC